MTAVYLLTIKIPGIHQIPWSWIVFEISMIVSIFCYGAISAKDDLELSKNACVICWIVFLLSLVGIVASLSVAAWNVNSNHLLK